MKRRNNAPLIILGILSLISLTIFLGIKYTLNVKAAEPIITFDEEYILLNEAGTTTVTGTITADATLEMVDLYSYDLEEYVGCTTGGAFPNYTFSCETETLSVEGSYGYELEVEDSNWDYSSKGIQVELDTDDDGLELLSLWRFDNESNWLLEDISGFSVSNNGATQNSSGNIQYAMSSSSGYLTLDDSSETLSFDQTDSHFKIEADVFSSDFSANQYVRVAGKNNSNNDENSWLIGIDNQSGVYCGIWNNPSDPYDQHSLETGWLEQLPDNQWSTIACEWDASTYSLSAYVNGELVDSNTAFHSNPINSSTSDFAIGARPHGGGNFNGLIDNVKISTPQSAPSPLSLTLDQSFILQTTAGTNTITGDITSDASISSVEIYSYDADSTTSCSSSGSAPNFTFECSTESISLDGSYKFDITANNSSSGTDTKTIQVETDILDEEELIALWRFDDDVNWIKEDINPLSVTSHSAVQTTSGKILSALNSSTGGYITIDDSTEFLSFDQSNSHFIVEAQVFSTDFSTASYKRVLGKNNSNNDENSWLMGIDNQSGLYCGVWNNPGDMYDQHSLETGGTSQLTNNQWNTISCEWDATTYTLTGYLNGIEVGSSTSPYSAPLHSSTYDFAIGARAHGGDGFPGYIDNVKIYDLSEELVTYTLTYTAGENGSISGDSPQTVNEGEDGSAVTAVADEGYLFIDWSDGSTSNPRTDTAVSGDITVSANFDLDQLSSSTKLYISSPVARFSDTLSSLGDVNGDGYDDLIIGAPGFGATPAIASAYYGSESGISNTPDWSRSYLNGSFESGIQVSGAGDVNNDNFDDVIISVNSLDVVYIYLGSLSGLSTTPDVTINTTAGSSYDVYVSNAGDINDDGYDDVLISDKYYETEPLKRGIVNLHLGNSSGIDILPSWSWASPDIYSIGETWGDSLSSAKDINNDGYDDVVIGTSVYDGEEDNVGLVQVFLGSETGLGLLPIWEKEGEVLGYMFGSDVAGVGDINGDGFDDILIGEERFGYQTVDETDSEGRIHLFFGSLTGLQSTADWTFESNSLNARLGDSVGRVGDINGDGYDDIIAGAYNLDTGDGKGKVYLFLGSEAGLDSSPNWTVEERYTDNTQFGWSVSGVGDVDNDGYDEILIGAPQYLSPLPSQGEAFLFMGDATTYGTPPVVTYTLTYTAGSNGSISGDSPQSVSTGEDGTQVSAVANAGYEFYKWSDGSTSNPRTDLNVTNSISVTAQFLPTGGMDCIDTCRLHTSESTTDYCESVCTFVDNCIDSSLTYGNTYIEGYPFEPFANLPERWCHKIEDNEIMCTQECEYYNDSFPGYDTTCPIACAEPIEDDCEDTIINDLGEDSNEWAGCRLIGYDPLSDHTLTYSAGLNGSILGTSIQTVSPGGDGTPVSAIANTGYRFSSWSDGSTSNPRTDLSVYADISVSASFLRQLYLLRYLTQPYGTISGQASQSVYYQSNGFEVEAIPNTGYYFVNWSDGSTQNPRQDVNISSNLTVEARYAPNVYTINYSSQAGGYILGSKIQNVSHGSNSSEVTALPYKGYRFVSWSDGSTINPRTDRSVTGNISVTALFVKIQYTLSYLTGGNGTVEGNTTQLVTYGNSGTEVEAIPNTGYKFSSWSDGSTTNPRTDINVTQNLTVTANFVSNFTEEDIIIINDDIEPDEDITDDVIIVVREEDVDTNDTEVRIYEDDPFGIKIPIELILDESEDEKIEDILEVYAILNNDVRKLTLSSDGTQFLGELESGETLGTNTVNILAIYKDGKKSKKTVSIGIDPYGYAYYINNRGEQVRVEGAEVTLVHIEDDGSESIYERVGQENPQITGIEGTYSFIVQPGTYYLSIKADGFEDYRSDVFTIDRMTFEINSELQRLPLWGLISSGVDVQRAVNIAIPVTILLFTSPLIPYHIARLLLGILSALKSRKKAQRYGFVYNSVTKEPISQAIVRIYDQNGTLVDTQVTGTYGEIIGNLEPGNYVLSVQKPSFTFPSKIVKNSPDGNIQNVYSSVLRVSSEAPEVLVGIPIDPVDAKVFRKIGAAIMDKGSKFTKFIKFVVFIGLFIYSVYIYTLYPNSINLLIILAYILLTILIFVSLIQPSVKYGKVISSFGDSIANMKLQLLETEFNTVVGERITDRNGRYRFITPPGRYVLRSGDSRYKVESDVSYNLDKKPSIINDKITVIPS